MPYQYEKEHPGSTKQGLGKLVNVWQENSDNEGLREQQSSLPHSLYLNDNYIYLIRSLVGSHDGSVTGHNIGHKGVY